MMRRRVVCSPGNLFCAHFELEFQATPARLKRPSAGRREPFAALKAHKIDAVTYMSSDLDFESVVARHYEPLYQFAFSLTRSEADSCDLTQQTFYVWAKKGHQLREVSKVKTWLFTTLYREFLESRRRQMRFPHYELDQVDSELPSVTPTLVNQLDAAQAIQA